MTKSKQHLQSTRNQTRKPSKEQQASAIQKVTAMLIDQQDQFLGYAKVTGLDWESEQLFALQAMSNNSSLASTALNNPASLKTAILNVAAIGISLNPEKKLAYLVPREGRVVLDISAKGMRTIAEQDGSILCARVELVYTNDLFKWNGPYEEPDFEADIFATIQQRGDFRGAFCTAILPNDQKMIEVMSAEEIFKIRNFSKAYTKNDGDNNSPWNTFFEEMVKKTLVKRARKNWPIPNKSSLRLETAIRVINEHEGLKDEQVVGNSDNLVCLSSQENESANPPFVYDESYVSKDVREKVAIIVNRAISANAWAAAKELVRGRYKLHDLHYALTALKEAHENPTLLPR